MRTRATPPQGFTLIELMMVTAIIGVLSSVAIPTFQRLQVRAKAAERGAIVQDVKRALETYVLNHDSIPNGALAGAWDPTVLNVAVKRRFDPSLDGWRDVSLGIEGSTYYSYAFTASRVGSTTTLSVSVQGDVDGDGDIYRRVWAWNGTGNVFVDAPGFPNPSSDAYDNTVF